MAEEASGAVELAVIAFPGSQFKGEIVPALADLVDAGTITILDLVLVSKTEEGDVVVIEIDEADDPAMFDDLDGEVTGILSDEDALAAGDALDPGNTAAVIVWENTWARALVGAIRNAGGLLVAHDRLDAETVNEALATIGE
jgi:FlaG/FlaF family flagellin (archaellin)